MSQTKSFEELEQENLELAIANEKLQKENEELSSKNAALEGENGDLKSVNADLQETVEQLSSKPVKTEKAVEGKAEVSQETFEVDGVKYGFRLRSISYQGKKITAAEVMADTELQKQLAEKQISLIKKV